MDYLLKASGVVMILYVFYHLFLKNETFFKSIRHYFLAGLIISVSIPLIEIPVYVEAVLSQLNTSEYNFITSEQMITQQPFDWMNLITIVYLIGVSVFGFKFLIQLISLAYLVSRHRIVKKGNIKFIETSYSFSPFSFFNLIIYNKAQFSIEELKQIINHEKAHVLQWHSLDTILSHLLVITLWFNPFVWMYKKAVQQNLEFLADSYALSQAGNKSIYQHTILKTCSTSYGTVLTNNFYNSLIKKRILMLQKNRSKKINQWKYALIFPVLIAFVFTFNTKVIAQEKKHTEVKEVVEFKEQSEMKELAEIKELIELSSERIELILDKNTTAEGLEKIVETFKSEASLTITFKGVKRNSNAEIIALRISAKGENSQAKFENSGAEAIKPIKISYNSETNAISIGNVGKLHKKHKSYTIHEDGNVHFKGDHKKGSYVFINKDGKKKTWTSKEVYGDKSKNVYINKKHSKDGDSHVWFSANDKDTLIHKEKIIIKKGDDAMWVGKNGENVNVKVIETDGGKIKVEVITEGDHEIKMIKELKDVKEIEKVHEIAIIKEGSGKGENVFIIKTDDGKAHKISKKKSDNFIFIGDTDKNPLIFIDGKEVSKEEMEKLDQNTMGTIEVLKGDKAVEKYGEKAKDGVILITTKKE